MFDFQDYGQGIHLIDTGYVRPQLAAMHLIVEGGRAAFFDTGTNASLGNALAALARLGLTKDSVDYVILSHIHLDHAGGAGAMMASFPNARLVVHPRGARHMAEPSKLVAGVTGVYGAEYVARMYGDIVPVAAGRIIEATHGMVIELAGRRLRCLDTPGHARHHICLVDERTRGIFTGDMFGLSYPGMAVAGREFIFPTTTPTQFEPTATRTSIELLMREAPSAMYLTHYGRVVDVDRTCADLLRHLDFHRQAALAERNSGENRHARIKAALTDYLLAERRSAGCTMSRETLLDWWEGDLELNAQGLEAWLDAGAPE